VQLIKTLPQKLRRNLVPVPEFAAPHSAAMCPRRICRCCWCWRATSASRSSSMRRWSAFRLELLPQHLLMNFRIVDEHGRQLGMSRNFAQLHSELAPRVAHEIVAVTANVEKGEAVSEQRYSAWELRPLYRDPRGAARRAEGHAEYTRWWTRATRWCCARSTPAMRRNPRIAAGCAACSCCC